MLLKQPQLEDVLPGKAAFLEDGVTGSPKMSQSTKMSKVQAVNFSAEEQRSHTDLLLQSGVILVKVHSI